MARQMKLNRGDPRNGAGPFANLVKGDAVQITPNGQARNEGAAPEYGEAEGFRAYPCKFFEPPLKDKGNRSGE